MKIFIIHDDTGRIRGTFLGTSETENVGVRIKNGLHVHTLEIDNLEANQRQKYLFDLHRNHFVNLLSGNPIVVKKKQRKPKK